MAKLFCVVGSEFSIYYTKPETFKLGTFKPETFKPETSHLRAQYLLTLPVTISHLMP